MMTSVEEALAALHADPGLVEVIGDGGLAVALRAGLRSRPGAPRERPGAVIETTGDPAAIRDALQRVADLGTVVLAGPATADPVALDLYADLHVRGLTIVGATSGSWNAP
jgi:threonine dehydrogenase-like Zn-dependent dehydrogenase